MKTEFLKGLGLDQETINKIMAENGKDINAVRSELEAMTRERDSYKDKAETAEEGLKKFDGVDVDGLNGQIAQLQKDLKAKDDEYAAKEADRLFNDTISAAIKDAGGRNPKAVMALLDMKTLKESKDQTADIKKALEDAKKSDAYLFGANEPFQNPVGTTGGGGGNMDVSTDALRAAMGLPAEKK